MQGGFAPLDGIQRADLHALRQGAFRNLNVVVLQDRALRELQPGDRIVVIDDGGVFAGQGVGEVSLRFEQDVDRAALGAGLEHLKSQGQLASVGFAMGALGIQFCVVLFDIAKFEREEAARLHFLILQLVVGALKIGVRLLDEDMRLAVADRHVEPQSERP